MWNTISWCVIQWLRKQFTIKYDKIVPLLINKHGVFQIFFDRNWEKKCFSKLTMYWWKKKKSEFEKLVMLRSQVLRGNDCPAVGFWMYWKERTWCFLMLYMRALKIFKPIYTLGIKILTLPEIDFWWQVSKISQPMHH